jgi:hypothetical protein
LPDGAPPRRVPIGSCAFTVLRDTQPVRKEVVLVGAVAFASFVATVEVLLTSTDRSIRINLH